MSNESFTWSPEPNGSSGKPDGTDPAPVAPGSDGPATPLAAPRHGYVTEAYSPPQSSLSDAAPFGSPVAPPTAQFSPEPPDGAPFGSPMAPPVASFGSPPPPYESTFVTQTMQSDLVVIPLDEAPRRRRGLWIGIAAGVLVLLGLGAGWVLVGSKLLAPASPTAAVNRFVDGLQHKDGLAMLGSVSPAEMQPFKQMAADLDKNTAATPDPTTTKALMDAFNSVSIKVDGLQTKEESLDNGLAKVTFTAGTLTIDGDVNQIADAFVAATANNPALGATGLQDTSAMRQTLVDSLTGKLPYTVDIATDWAANGEAPYLVTVHEGHGWYVSPLMTLGEYLTQSKGVQRGAMPKAADIAHPSSPADAAKQLAAAIPAFVSGDSGPLVSVLPEAERRFVAVYLLPVLDDGKPNDPSTQLTLTASDFDVADQTADRASVLPTNLAYTLVQGGVSGTISYDGDCLAIAPDGNSSGGGCISDLPLLGDFGLGHPALVSVHENGGWYVSFVGTLADWTGKVANASAQLKAEGKLDDPSWLEQELGGALASADPGAGL
jgi:hypothetical protein